MVKQALKGVEQCAKEMNYSILIGDTQTETRRLEAYFRQIEARHVDGVILLDGQTAFNQVLRAGAGAGVRTSLYPVVTVSERVQGVAWPHVGIDDVAAARQLVRHLIQLGHRRIAHVLGPAGNVPTIDRLYGFCGAMLDAGLEIRDAWIVQGDFSVASGRAAARALMRARNRPSAIFAASDAMAMGAIAELRLLGITVPRDVSVVGFDDIEFAEVYDPPITTIRQPRLEMGRIAMGLLVRMLQSPAATLSDVLLPTELIRRVSCQAPATD